MAHTNPPSAESEPLGALRSIASATIERSTPLQRALAFGFIPVVLLIVGSLPLALQEQWVLQLDTPTVTQLYLSNFVHNDIHHLSNNIISYLLLMGTLFPLAVAAREQRVLAMLSMLFLTVVPLLVSAYTMVTLAGTSAETVAGFSGVNAAFAGTLPLFIALFVNERIREIGVAIGTTGLMGAELGVVLWLAGQHHLSVLLLTGLSIIGLGLAVLAGEGNWYTQRHYEQIQLTLATLFFGAVPFTLIVTVDAGTNVYGHLIGLVGGFLISLLLLSARAVHIGD